MGWSPTPDLLLQRLQTLGLDGLTVIETHTNRSVMVSRSPSGALRLHQGYAHAPDRVLAAIVRFLRPRGRRASRLAARRVLLAFPVELYAPPSEPVCPPRLSAEDQGLVDALRQLHEILNRDYFEGRLNAVSIRLSFRMRTRLGELRLERRSSQPLEIAISRRHCRRDPWSEVVHTMLHEMVHQWQAETGLPVSHGAAFRRKANQIGIEPRAMRVDGAGSKVAG